MSNVPSCQEKAVVCVQGFAREILPTFFTFAYVFFQCEVVFGGTHMESGFCRFAKLDLHVNCLSDVHSSGRV